MRKTLVCTALLLLAGTSGLSAQQHCRSTRNGRVVVCERDRDRDRGRHDRRDNLFQNRGPIEFGIRGGYDFEDHQGSAGTQVRIPVIRQFTIAPSFDAFFGDQGATWQANVDGLIRPDRLGGLYGGGGVAFLRRDFDGTGNETKAGWNLVAGIDGNHLGRSALRPFVETRWTGTEDDFTAFRLVAGVNVPIGGIGRGRW